MTKEAQTLCLHTATAALAPGVAWNEGEGLAGLLCFSVLSLYEQFQQPPVFPETVGDKTLDTVYSSIVFTLKLHRN